MTSGAVLGGAWRVVASALTPALRLHLRRRVGRGKEIAERLGEREGIDPAPRPEGRLLWIHAASVGETVSILPVLAALRARTQVLLTTGTVTSQELLRLRLVEMGLAPWVIQRFAPLDVPAWVERFLAHWRPDAACFVESELWPNQLASCRARGIPMMLLNGRMSDASFRSWRRVPGFARLVLGGFALVQARSDSDADRLRALGAKHVDSPGDLKFAAPPLPADPVELARLQGVLAGRPVWLAASTHPGEEEMVAAVHRLVAETHPGLVTILAPRHPERGAELGAALGAPRRGAGDDPPAQGGIWIADTLGELGLWYRLAPVALIGRSLIAPGGGQNPLEAARLGCAIVVGPHTGNFTDAVALLRAERAVSVVGGIEGLAAFVGRMLDDADARRAMGAAAARVANRHADLPARSAEALLSLLPAV